MRYMVCSARRINVRWIYRIRSINEYFLPPNWKINAVIESYPKGIAGFKRYVELLETEPDIVDSKDAMEVKHVHGDIQYNNITFDMKTKNRF